MTFISHQDIYPWVFSQASVAAGTRHERPRFETAQVLEKNRTCALPRSDTFALGFSNAHRSAGQVRGQAPHTKLLKEQMRAVLLPPLANSSHRMIADAHRSGGQARG
jgi:hypothetical protein